MSFNPTIAQQFHINELVSPKGWYEHVCPQMPVRYGVRKIRVLSAYGPAFYWHLKYGALQEKIHFCPWCSRTLPDHKELACDCGRDQVEREHGYGLVVMRQYPFVLQDGRAVDLDVEMRVTHFKHKDHCPARNTPIKGSA